MADLRDASPEAETQKAVHLVVIGASAGGIEALSTLASTIRPDFPAALVVAQHLDPRHPSHLQEILARHSGVPVRTVADSAPLEPGILFVVPADRHVVITDHSVGLSKESTGRPKPSIDLLFSSAAESFGEALIAVVLTGMGSDGAEGARRVKEVGGTVVIQDPRTASFPAMPRALSPTTVDVVAQLETIGPLLYDLLTGVYLPARPAESRLLHVFLHDLRERTGIDFSSYKMSTIVRRLGRRMAAVGTPHLAEYQEYLDRHREEYARLINAFLIKVTEFFRDPELFAYLRREILPELIQRAIGRGNELRLWSAGCATGEEAYSLAILVCEVLGKDLDRFNIRIFATDLDGEAIAFARHGVYPATALAGVPPELVALYFRQVDGSYEVSKFVRALVVFGEHDLAQRAPFPHIDLVLCRNVLIYFTPQLQRHALHVFAFSLRNDGYLVLGKSETTNPLAEFFAPAAAQLKVFRRHGERPAIPLDGGVENALLSALPRVVRDPAPATRDTANARREAQQAYDAQHSAEELLLRLPVGVVVVDRRYDIQVINSTARRLFGIYSSAIGDDFLHLLRAIPTEALRPAIDQALAGTPQAIEALPTTNLVPGETRYLSIVCQPHAAGLEESDPLVALVVSDSTDNVLALQSHLQARAPVEGERDALRIQVASLTGENQSLTAARDEALSDVQRHREAHETLRAERLAGEARARQERAASQALIEQLTTVNRQILAANEELTAANMSLRRSNEAFLVGHDEAQAASEETETLNEELQASNEELETLNEELQATVEELHTTNDDLQARSGELLILADSLETQRQRLAVIVGALDEAVAVIDRHGKAVFTSPGVGRLFGARGLHFLPEDADGVPLPAPSTPQQRAARGETFQMEFTLTGDGGARRRFEVGGRPIGANLPIQEGMIVIRELADLGRSYSS